MGTNNHGFHGNRYCVNYEEIYDIPSTIVFKASPDIRYGVHTIQVPGLTEEENKKVIEEVRSGFQVYRGGMFRAVLMNRDTAFRFMNLKKNYRSFSIRIFTYGEFMNFERNKTKETNPNAEEQVLFDEILNLEDIRKTPSLLKKLEELLDSPFKRRALLLLKITACDLEDQHFLEEKQHRPEDLEVLKIFKKTNYSQTEKE